MIEKIMKAVKKREQKKREKYYSRSSSGNAFVMYCCNGSRRNRVRNSRW